MNKKIDYKQQLKEFYKPKTEPVIVRVPEYNFLMIDGENAEESNPQFQQAIEALFSVSYKIKFLSKQELDRDYTVMPLEGLWWADDMDDFLNGRKERWKYTLMIFQPDFIRKEFITNAIQITKTKKDNPSLDLLRFEQYEEGDSAQVLHIGPFAEEHGNITKLHNMISESGGSFNGQVQKHHEIYLSDFRKTAPEKLRTVIRQPFIK